VQPLRPTPDELRLLEAREALDRIEAAVAAGSTDLSALGFWAVVGQIKRDRVMVAELADQTGRIDQAAFRARIRLRVPVGAGTALMAAVVIGGVVAIVLAGVWTGALAGLALLAAGGAWSLGVHSPTHQAFAWVVGIRCTAYFLGGPPPPRPGIKTDYASYLRTDPARRAWFHASGAIATKLAPFVAVALAPLTNAPAWAVIAMAAYGVFQIVSDVLFSTRASDWKKFLRERAVANELRRRNEVPTYPSKDGPGSPREVG
jgi:hypothetical protein